MACVETGIHSSRATAALPGAPFMLAWAGPRSGALELRRYIAHPLRDLVRSLAGSVCRDGIPERRVLFYRRLKRVQKIVEPVSAEVGVARLFGVFAHADRSAKARVSEGLSEVEVSCPRFFVIAHPGMGSGWVSKAVRMAVSTATRLALAVLTTERKAA